MRPLLSKVGQGMLAEIHELSPGKFFRTHDAFAPEKYTEHQQHGEHDHTETGTEQRNSHPEKFQRFIKDTQIFQASRYNNSAQHTAGNTAHTAQDDNQQEVVR